jgi:hypothetical protein
MGQICMAFSEYPNFTFIFLVDVMFYCLDGI